MRYRAVSIVLTACALSGCASGQTEFYTLRPAAPSMQTEVQACAGAPIMVANVVLPAVLDRQEMVRAGSGDALDISGKDRWAAPLGSLIQRVFAEDLRERLPQGRVLAPGDPTPPGGAMTLRVNVQRFMAEDTDHVALDADWGLLNAGGHTLLWRSESVRVTAAAAGPDTAAAMSKALGILADRVAAILAACPS